MVETSSEKHVFECDRGKPYFEQKKNENKIRKQAKNNTRVALLSESNKITSMSSDSQRFALVLITK